MSNSLDPDRPKNMSDLIWVQTVCKAYQQTILVGNKLSTFYLVTTIFDPQFNLQSLKVQCILT